MILAITTAVSMLIPVIYMSTAVFLSEESQLVDISIGFTLFSGIILWLIIIPIAYIAQVITLILKIFAKNKVKKDYIIIAANILTLSLFGYIFSLGMFIGSRI